MNTTSFHLLLIGCAQEARHKANESLLRAPHHHQKITSHSAPWHPRPTPVRPIYTISSAPTTRLLRHWVPAMAAVTNLNHIREVTVSYLTLSMSFICCLQSVSTSSPLTNQPPLPLIKAHSHFPPLVPASPSLLEALTGPQEALVTPGTHLSGVLSALSINLRAFRPCYLPPGELRDGSATLCIPSTQPALAQISQ